MGNNITDIKAMKLLLNEGQICPGILSSSQSKVYPFSVGRKENSNTNGPLTDHNDLFVSITSDSVNV